MSINPPPARRQGMLIVRDENLKTSTAEIDAPAAKAKRFTLLLR